jgi:hypothetical protein
MQLKKFKAVFLPLMLDQLSFITQAFEKDNLKNSIIIFQPFL